MQFYKLTNGSATDAIHALQALDAGVKAVGYVSADGAPHINLLSEPTAAIAPYLEGLEAVETPASFLPGANVNPFMSFWLQFEDSAADKAIYQTSNERQKDRLILRFKDLAQDSPWLTTPADPLPKYWNAIIIGDEDHDGIGLDEAAIAELNEWGFELPFTFDTDGLMTLK